MRSFLFIVLVALMAGCTKDLAPDQCQELKQAIVVNDVEKVKMKITEAITGLPAPEHTEQNLNTLATVISAKCGLAAKVLCFGCIKTLPEQSEIRVSFVYSGSVISKTIDISYSPDNKIRFVNLHE